MVYDNNFKLVKEIKTKKRIISLSVSNSKLYVLDSDIDESDLTNEMEYLSQYDVKNNFNLIKSDRVVDMPYNIGGITPFEILIPMK
jgi:hypothetical protein